MVGTLKPDFTSLAVGSFQNEKKKHWRHDSSKYESFEPVFLPLVNLAGGKARK
jgi:hypothetical protein